MDVSVLLEMAVEMRVRQPLLTETQHTQTGAEFVKPTNQVHRITVGTCALLITVQQKASIG